MKKYLACTVALAIPLLVAAPSFAQTASGSAPTATSSLPPGAAATPPERVEAASPTAGAAKLSAADKAFVTKAAEGGLAEVQMAQLAQQKTQTDDVKQFAQHMIDDHTPNNEALAKLAAAKGLTPPAMPSPTQQKMIGRLQGLDGGKFDKTYIAGQVKAHAAMLKAFQAEAKGGKDADLKAFAAQTVPTIEQHLTMAQGLEKPAAKS